MIVIIFLSLLSGIVFAQTGQNANQGKKDQIGLLNEVYASYGIGSIFYFINQNNNNSQNSNNSYSNFGTIIIGYTRTLNKIIGVGFQLGFAPVTIQFSNNDTYTQEVNNYLQALARIKFQYLNKPTFAMYSGIAIGVTMDYFNQSLKNGTTTKTQKLLPAGQLTLLGFRVGRGVAFCGEFGIGTLSILNLGVSFKFGQ